MDMSTDAVTGPPARLAQPRRLVWSGAIAALGAVLVVCVYIVGRPVFNLAYEEAVNTTTVTIHIPEPSNKLPAEIAPATAPAADNPPQPEVPASPQLPDREPFFATVQREDRLNILLFGFDTRVEDPSAPRTDTLMLLSWNQETNALDILSIPRDLWVPVPGFPPTKVNLVYSLGETVPSTGGGERLLADTLSAFLNQPIHHYAWVNFDGFVRIIDLLGGIDIYVPWAIYDEKYPTPDYGVETFELPAGPQHLDGVTTLKYARTRTQDGDYGRIGRQQAVISAVLRQVSDPNNATDLLAAAPNIIRTLRGNFGTDMNIARMLQLAQKGTANTPQTGRRLILDRHHGEEAISEEGMWVLIPDRTTIRAALSDFFGVSVQPLQAPSVSADAGS